jgi:hypothetical protein
VVALGALTLAALAVDLHASTAELQWSTLVHDWLPEMAAMLGVPAPRHVPAWLARLLVGGWGVAYMTGLAGAANAHARQQLDWKPTYSGWRSGLTADLGLRAPGESQNQAARPQ